MRDPNVLGTTLVRLELKELSRADLALLLALRLKYPDLPALSRAALKILFREKRIRLLLGGPASSERILSASDELRPGIYCIAIRDWNPESDLAPNPSFNEDTRLLSVIFEDEDLFILHKVSGMPSVPLKPRETDTAVSSALRHLTEASSLTTVDAFVQIGKSRAHPLEAGLLHRLDTGTSGVLAFAKNKKEFDRIRSLWRTKEVRKFYRAVVQADPIQHAKLAAILKTLPYSITSPIAHDPKSAKRMLALHDPRAQSVRGKILHAVTRILDARILRSTEHPLYELTLEIETGVMHQIRVHLASIGLPIVGDPLYGGAPTSSTRLLLHHERLILPLRSGAKLNVSAKLPEDWALEIPSKF